MAHTLMNIIYPTGQADVQLRSVPAQVIWLSDFLFLGYPVTFA